MPRHPACRIGIHAVLARVRRRFADFQASMTTPPLGLQHPAAVVAKPPRGEISAAQIRTGKARAVTVAADLPACPCAYFLMARM
jgi:hypothetical protein